MRRARILLFLGVWVAVLPYLGFPYSWKDLLFTLSGLILMCMSYLLYLDHKTKESKTFDNFLENDTFSENEVVIEETIEVEPEEN